jgi:hypothetical protein
MPNITTNLGPGSSGKEVEELQKYLVSQGFMTQAEMNTGPGTYGPKTTAAVTAWQKANGVVPKQASDYGYFGPLSREKLTKLSGTTTTSTGTAPTTGGLSGTGTVSPGATTVPTSTVTPSQPVFSTPQAPATGPGTAGYGLGLGGFQTPPTQTQGVTFTPQTTTGASSLADFATALDAAANMAKQKRNSLSLGMMSGYSGTLAASDFNGILGKLNQASDTTASNLINRAMTAATPQYTTQEINGSLYQMAYDASGRFTGATKIADIPKTGASFTYGTATDAQGNMWELQYKDGQMVGQRLATAGSQSAPKQDFDIRSGPGGSIYAVGTDAKGNPVATPLVEAPVGSSAGGFTLGKNATRYDAQGNIIATTVGAGETGVDTGTTGEKIPTLEEYALAYAQTPEGQQELSMIVYGMPKPPPGSKPIPAQAGANILLKRPEIKAMYEQEKEEYAATQLPKGAKFTNSQLQKLTQAGLLNAPLQKQLDYLHPPKNTSAGSYDGLF